MKYHPALATVAGAVASASSPIDQAIRSRDFQRAKPHLRRLAGRLLHKGEEIDWALEAVEALWRDTEGSFDAPKRYLLRLLANQCLTSIRKAPSLVDEPTDEERAVRAIADEAQVSLLIAINRLPRRARQAYVESILGRPARSPQQASLVVEARKEVRASKPHLSGGTAGVSLSSAPFSRLSVTSGKGGDTAD